MNVFAYGYRMPGNFTTNVWKCFFNILSRSIVIGNSAQVHK